ncbi:S41 family peptidase [Epilithonimonas hominis]|uniref:S41 family peptidase n=1 Tax=Epilithonimonas hominis TaxID=420404 RepID=UPI00289C0B0D|nr:S41 family peptidase [Epilithonimonas hominis]
MKAKITILFNLFFIFNFSQTDFQIQKLEDFTKIYSVARHFHPSDESAKLDWDLFTVFAVEEVLKTKNQNEFETAIKNLFLPIVPSMTFNNKIYDWDTKNAEPVFWINKGLGSNTLSKTYGRQIYNRDNIPEFIEKDLGRVDFPKTSYTLKFSDKFSVTIPLIVYKKNGKTFPTGDLEIYPKFMNQNFNQNVALSNVIIAWSGLRHFYPYQDEKKVDWNSILRRALSEAYNNKTEYENFNTLRRFLHNFNDGHMSVAYNPYFAENTFAPGINLKYLRITKEVVVSDILDDKTGLKKGDIIKRINGKDAMLVVDSLNQYQSGSEHFNIYKSVKQILKGKENSLLELETSNAQFKLVRNININKNYNFFNKINLLEIEKLSDSILYINLDNLTDKTAKENLELINSYKKIILDLRGYPRKKGDKVLMEEFFWDRNHAKFFSFPMVENPFYENVKYTERRGWKQSKKQELDATIVLLIDERCASYPESVSKYLKANDFVTIMGRPTAGANGDRNDILLLNGLKYSFTGMKVRNADNSIFFGIGAIPDIIIEESMDDIKQGSDTFIKEAVNYLKRK